MAYGFNMELRNQQEWSWLLALDLCLGGLGGGLFVLYQVFDLPRFIALLSLGLVVLGGVVLLSELGHPLRAWRAIARLRTSWISRGVLFVSFFLVAASLYLASASAAFSWFPWTEDTLGARVAWFVAGLCAVLITVYPGFVLSASAGIPFWNTRLLPLLFLTHSAMGASGIVLLISPVHAYGQVLPQIESLAAVLMVANFVLTSIYLAVMNHSGGAARESVRLLNRDPLGWTFRIGVILVGMLLPLFIVLWLPSATGLAGAFILIGTPLFRYCVLKAGVYVPSALVGADRGKLKPISVDLLREFAGLTTPRS